MDRKHLDTANGLEQQNGGEYTVKSNYRANIIAAVICLLLALFIWIMVMGKTDCDYVPVRVVNEKENYTYVLSVDTIKVEGKISDLRHAEEIGVRLPENAGEGEYRLSAKQLELELPEGVGLSVDIELVVTVKAK